MTDASGVAEQSTMGRASVTILPLELYVRLGDVYVHVMVNESSFTNRLQPRSVSMLVEPFTDPEKPVVLYYYS